MSGTVSASWVRLHELCLQYLNSLQDLSSLRYLSLRRGRSFDGLVDELRLLSFQALSGPSFYFFDNDMMSAAREQSCVWWAPSGCPETEKKKAA